MVAVLRKECEELKKRQKRSKNENKKTLASSDKTKAPPRDTPSPDMQMPLQMPNDAAHRRNRSRSQKPESTAAPSSFEKNHRNS